MSTAPVSLGTISDIIPTSIVVPPIDYTSRDYTSLINDLLTLIPSYLPEWTDRSPGDLGIVMIELFAYVGDIINYYSDRIANEAFIATAQQRQSVLNLAQLLDYTPHNNVAAILQLQFTISSPSAPVLIPQGTQAATLGGVANAVTFQTTQDLWLFGDGVHPPGSPINAISNAQPHQTFALGNDNVPYPTYLFNQSGNQTVTVGGTAWTLAPNNSWAGVATNATMYVVINIKTAAQGGGGVIQLGDGVHGAIPPNGVAIVITYQPHGPAHYNDVVAAQNGDAVTGETIGIADGSPYQAYTLFNTPVVDGSVSVYVDEGAGPTLWQYFQRIVDAGPSDPAYTLSTDANSVVTVSFGDNVTGMIPAAGAVITANYSVGGGVVGNVAAGTVTQLLSGPSNITAVTNPNAASGGADTETLDHIRIHAPLSITAINRAVTLDDYAALILNIPSIAKASASSTAYNAVNINIHPAGDFFGFGNNATTTVAALNAAVGLLAPTVTNSSYTGYLDDKKMVTTSVVVLPPQYNNNGVLTTGYVPCNVSVTVQVLPQYSNSSVQSSVLAAIQNLFLFAVVDFGFRVSLSSVYHACMNVEGVDYVNVTVMARNEANQAAAPADIVCYSYEIPQAYQLNVTANGGIQ